MITHDIQKFSNNLAAIYANLAKPVLDVIIYNYQLSQNVGAEGLVLLTVLVQLSAALRKNFASPPFFRTSKVYVMCSTQAHTTIWSLYLNVSSSTGCSASHTLKAGGICGRDSVFQRRRDREDVGRARICRSHYARERGFLFVDGGMVALKRVSLNGCGVALGQVQLVLLTGCLLMQWE